MDDNLLMTNVSSIPKTTNEISNVIVDGNDTIITSVDEEVTKDDVNRSNEEKTFYSKVNEYRTSLKYPEKTMISLDYYNKIIHALKYVWYHQSMVATGISCQTFSCTRATSSDG